MAVRDAVRAGGTYATRLVESDYARENLSEALDKIRAAQRRASGRKASKIADDKKLYAQVREAATALREAGNAVVKGKEPPKRSWPKRLVLTAIVGGGIAVALNSDLRERLVATLGSATPGESEAEV